MEMVILPSMLARYRLNQHFENNKHLKKVCVAVLFFSGCLQDYWFMDFVQIFMEHLEYFQWFTLGVSNVYVQRRKIRTIHIRPILHWIFGIVRFAAIIDHVY